MLGREQILKVHMKKVPLAPDVKAKVIARGTPGFSGADLANLVNEAALLAARKNKRLVTMAEFEDAKDKVMMGAERRSMVMTEDEKALTAYHEAGHALVALSVPKSDPLHKVTIIPRGRALGVTMSLPERDKYGYSKVELTSKLAMMFGGRVAEELIFGEENVTTGAGNDIQQATGMARRMVTEWGFSEKLGPLRYSANEEEVFLGHSVTQQKNMSDQTADLIDSEVRSLIEDAEATARQVLEDAKTISNYWRRHFWNMKIFQVEKLTRCYVAKISHAQQKTIHPPAMVAEHRCQCREEKARQKRWMGWNPSHSRVPDGLSVLLRHPSCKRLSPLALITSPVFHEMLYNPVGLLEGAGAKLAIENGKAQPLAGGNIAFTHCEVLDLHVDRFSVGILPLAEIKVDLTLMTSQRQCHSRATICPSR